MNDALPAEGTEKPRVFICYAKEDQQKVGRLAMKLKEAGADPWIDMHRLVIGDYWKNEIQAAISRSDVCVICFSKHFEKKGFKQREIRMALDEAQERPLDQTFIIPYILEPCNIPEELSKIHRKTPSQPTPLSKLLDGIEKQSRKKLSPESLNFIRAKSLIPLLESPNTNDRMNACKALWEIGPEAAIAIPSLCLLLDDWSVMVRQEAFSTLSRLGTDAVEAVPALLKALTEGQCVKDRSSAAFVLGNIGEEAKDAFEALVTSTRDMHGEIRSSAVSALRWIGGDPDVLAGVAISAMSDSDWQVQWEGCDLAYSLWKNDAGRILSFAPYFIRLVREETSRVRGHAANHLSNAKIRSDDAISALISATKDSESINRMCAVRALGRIGVMSSKVLQAIEVCLEDENEDTRNAAKQALDLLNDTMKE